MDELTERLSVEQRVEVGGPEPTLEEFHTRLTDIGTVFVKFTETRGGTDLGIRLDREATDLSGADFDARTGTVHVTGTLTLNGDRVRCVADIDLATLKGVGRLALAETADA